MKNQKVASKFSFEALTENEQGDLMGGFGVINSNVLVQLELDGTNNCSCPIKVNTNTNIFPGCSCSCKKM